MARPPLQPTPHLPSYHEQHRFWPNNVLYDKLPLAPGVLDVAGVAVTPGLDFDPKRGSAMLRFSYARSTDDIREGLHRLENYMRQRGFIE